MSEIIFTHGATGVNEGDLVSLGSADGTVKIYHVTKVTTTTLTIRRHRWWSNIVAKLRAVWHYLTTYKELD